MIDDEKRDETGMAGHLREALIKKSIPLIDLYDNYILGIYTISLNNDNVLQV